MLITRKGLLLRSPLLQKLIATYFEMGFLMSMASVFSKIISGDLPSYKVFEDEFTFAFLAMEAIRIGHTLIVPKIEIDYFVDVPEPYYSRVFENVKSLSKAIHRATGW